MLLEQIKTRHAELIETIIINYSFDYDSDQYNTLFDACFNLSDFICQAECEEYIDDHSLRTASAIYVTKSISELIDTHTLNVKHGLDVVRNAVTKQGSRMKEAFSITQNYFENEGLLEIVSSSNYYTNFRMLTRPAFE